MTDLELGRAFAIGLGLGVVTGLPLGVVNVAIVEAAARRGARTATGVGVGGAAADLVHAALAFGGVGGAIVARPAAAAALHAIAGAVLCGYAILLWRRRDPSAATARQPPATVGRAVLAGFALTLPNPAALGAWIAVAAAITPPSMVAGLLTAAGVFVGSASWFIALARLAARGSIQSGAANRTLTRGVAMLLGALGIAAIVRAVL